MKSGKLQHCRLGCRGFLLWCFAFALLHYSHAVSVSSEDQVSGPATCTDVQQASGTVAGALLQGERRLQSQSRRSAAQGELSERIGAAASSRNPSNVIIARAGKAADALVSDTKKFLHGWFQGFGPGWQDLKNAAVAICLSTCWLMVYFGFIYRDDRGIPPMSNSGAGDGDRDDRKVVVGGAPLAVAPANCGAIDDYPHLVIVFRHPNHPSASGEGEENMDESALRRLHACAGTAAHCNPDFFDAWLRDHQGTGNLRLVRDAVLQGLCKEMPELGFETYIFSSLDDDELYLCFSLRRQEVLEFFMARDDHRVSLHRDSLTKLGIAQCLDDASSELPKLRCGTASRRTFGDLEDKASFPDSERIRIIYKEISAHVNLDAAREEGVILDWFPGHEVTSLENVHLASRALRGSWGLGLQQPLSQIHNYFGPRVALDLAWVGMHCKALLSLVPVAIALCLVDWIGELERRSNMLAFPAIILVWARISSNIWHREVHFLSALWYLKDNEAPARPHFRGELQPSPVDSNVPERQESVFVSRSRALASWLAMFVFCLVAACVFLLWNTAFRGEASMLQNVGISVLIFAFGQMGNHLIKILTHFENHKWDDGHYSSYVWKLFFVQAFSRYFVFIYEVFAQLPNADQKGCLSGVRLSLLTTLASLCACEMIAAVKEPLMVKVNIWYEDWKLQGFSHRVIKRPWIEEQSKYAPWLIESQVDTTMQLVLTLGYIMIFGLLSVEVAPLCFCVFFVQLRVSTFLLEHYVQRPFPYETVATGVWIDVLRPTCFVILGQRLW
eukprot:TRINITY_DN21182_c0_g1_i2.p1 TRINITY_DN21182_c0_g1~~TRINITY_DN21182_c0_g1_i2.p1  ORF type:complete len:787 (-),score=104.82 TRINITY_DN21182_c0_g1_i2:316-2676(-)